MLTKVYLDGVMGKKFGQEWELEVSSPREALSMIDANVPGVFTWIKNNLAVYDRYQVIVEYESGAVEELENDTYSFDRKMKSIRFVPVVQGSGNTLRIVVGIVLLVVGAYFGNQPLMSMGVSLIIGGVIGMLTPVAKINNDQSKRTDGTSYYFNGPANTTGQGVPVPLIYGRCLVGSHAISAAATVDQML